MLLQVLYLLRNAIEVSKSNVAMISLAATSQLIPVSWKRIGWDRVGVLLHIRYNRITQ